MLLVCQSGADAMDEDSTPGVAENGTHDGGVLPEVEAYAFLIVVLYFVDSQRMELVSHQGTFLCSNRLAGEFARLSGS